MLTSLGVGGSGAFFLFGSFTVLATLFAYLVAPETKGMSLEAMESLFGGTPNLLAERDAQAEMGMGEDVKKDKIEEIEYA